MDRRSFLEKTNWFGSFYELAIEYHPGGDDNRLLKALSAIWKLPIMKGPWQDVNDFGSDGNVPTILNLNKKSFNTFGLMTLSENTVVGCQTLIVREREGSDWLDICIPTGMLTLIGLFDNKKPREEILRIQEIDHVFIKIAEQIYGQSPFDLAIVGEEVSGQVYSNSLDSTLQVPSGLIVPQSIFEKINFKLESKPLYYGLKWFL